MKSVSSSSVRSATLLAVLMLLLMVLPSASCGPQHADFGDSPQIAVQPLGPSTQPAITPFQTPEQELQDYDLAKQNPINALPEKDGAGNALIYYGRAFIRNRHELHALDVLLFTHRSLPFFDEWDQMAARTFDTGAFRQGKWEYAIATGTQWNVLVQHPGIVGAIEINPRSDAHSSSKIPHPLLDGIVAGQPGASLNPRTLANLGFAFVEPKLPKAAACSTGRLHPLKFIETDWEGGIGGIGVGGDDILSDGFNWLVNTVTNGVKIGVEGATSILTGVGKIFVGAINGLASLGNSIVCLGTGTGSFQGRFFVMDPKTGQPVKIQIGPNAGQPEPLRRESLMAWGGIGGILLATAEADDAGFFEFTNLCHDINYDMELVTESDAAVVSDNTVVTNRVFVDQIFAARPNMEFAIPDMRAVYLIAAQIGKFNAQSLYGISPRHAEIVVGAAADEVGGISGGRAVTLCGQLVLIGSLLPFQPTDGDIYMPGGVSDAGGGPFSGQNPLGVSLHEYGHFAMCEVLRQRGHGFSDYMNKYTGQLIQSIAEGFVFDEDKNAVFASKPLRNTSESLADFFVYQAMGYTNYFKNENNTNNLCSQNFRTTTACLDDGTQFVLTPPVKADPVGQYRQWIASRTSIMFDWMDGIRPDPTLGTHDTDLTIPTRTIAAAAGAVAPDLYTNTLSNWIAARPPFPAEGICTIYQNHAWDCAGLTAGGQLSAPTNFTGFAISSSEINWSWSPTSHLATSYVLMTGTPSPLTDTFTASPAIFQHTQSGLAPNQQINAVVEARATGATAGRSAQRNVCTLTSAPTNVQVTRDADGIHVKWPFDKIATDYVIERADGPDGTEFTPILRQPDPPKQPPAVQDPFDVIDDSAAPGVPYLYRVVARNCDGRPTPSTVFSAQSDFNDVDFLFVRAGAIAAPTGTRAAPFPTISDALAHVTPTRHRIIVQDGLYQERLKIEATTGTSVAIFGGYDANWKRNLPSKTTVAGDTTDWVIGGPNEQGSSFNYPIVAIYGSNPAVLDGLEFIPSAGLSTTRFNFVDAPDGANFQLSHVDYIGVTGDLRFPQGGAAGEPSISTSGKCTIRDSYIQDSVSSYVGGLSGPIPFQGQELVLIGCAEVSMSGTTLVGIDGRTGISSQTVAIDRSVVRADPGTAVPSGGTAVLADCVDIKASLLAGGANPQLGIAALNQNVGDGKTGKCSTGTVVNTTLFGSTVIESAKLLNDILISPSIVLTVEPPSDSLCGTCGPTNMGGYVIRNNLFIAIPPASSSGIVKTSFRDNAALGLLGSDGLNQPQDWFGPIANQVQENFAQPLNLVFSTKDLIKNIVPLQPNHDLHPLASSAVWFRGTTAYRDFGVSVPIDLDGTRHEERNVTNITGPGPTLPGRVSSVGPYTWEGQSLFGMFRPEPPQSPIGHPPIGGP